MAFESDSLLSEDEIPMERDLTIGGPPPDDDELSSGQLFRIFPTATRIHNTCRRQDRAHQLDYRPLQQGDFWSEVWRAQVVRLLPPRALGVLLSNKGVVAMCTACSFRPKYS